MIDARQIANWFISHNEKCENKPMALTRLNNLVYISHAWHIGLYDMPLIQNKIEAWSNGPIIVDLYHTFKRQGRYVTHTSPHQQTNEHTVFLAQIYNEYRKKPSSAFRDNAWKLTLNYNGKYAIIYNNLLKHHYSNKLLKQHYIKS